MSQNDIKKGLGVCSYKVTHMYNYRPDLYLKVSIKLKFIFIIECIQFQREWLCLHKWDWEKDFKQ